MSFLSQLLEYYHLTVKDLGARNVPGSFASLEKPFENSAFLSAVNRIKAAIDNHEKTVIYGDYDVDGITATTIMKRVLDEKGLVPGYFIPSRYKEGYGLNSDRVKEFAKKGYHLIITVDNGVSCIESISLARELGMEVIIIDHHEILETLPDTPYLFHQFHSGFLSYNCSAASLCFFIASYLRGSFDEYDATLAGMAVFSDVMPLVGNNLNLAKIMLDSLRKNKYPNLLCFLDNDISYHSVGFNLNPILNAPGRVSHDVMSTNHVVSFLLENKNTERMQRLSNELLSINEERKRLVKTMSLIKPIESDYCKVYQYDVGQGLSYSGLTGSVANKIMRETDCPVIIFSKTDMEKDMLVGSIRMQEGYDVLPFLEKYSKYFIRKGGHNKAAGITIAEKDYYQIATLFMTDCMEQSFHHVKVKKEIPIVIEDLSKENFDIYESFMPFGEGFEEPRFSLTIEKDNLFFSKNGNAIFSKDNGKNGRLCCFKNSSLVTESLASAFVFHGTLRKSVFNGVIRYELLADKMTYDE